MEEERACPRAVRRAVGAAAASLLPGLGHVLAGRVRAGLALLAATALLVLAALAGLAALGTGGLAQLSIRPGFLVSAMAVLGGAGLAWCAAIVSAYRAARPARMSRLQAGAARLVVGAVCLAVLVPVGWGMQGAAAARRLLTTTFAGDGAPVAVGTGLLDDPELTLLLLGGDGGPNRRGVRTDAIVLARIDTRTGDTRLVSLPRNLQRVPMVPGSRLAKAYPKGFGGYWFSVYEVAQAQPDLMPHVRPRYAGAAAFTELVEHTTGVDVDHYVVADLGGFRRLIDAIGGVTLDVRSGDGRPLPIGGASAEDGRVLERPTGALELGLQHLDGYEALWYARSRFSSGDAERQERQRCLLTALARQASPGHVLRNVSELASAASDALLTDIPADVLPALADLARRTASDATITGYSVAKAAGSSRRPDLGALRERVQALLDAPARLTGPVPEKGDRGGKRVICPGS